ncbi:hypothetical protein CYMTET_49808 [Cymbomonas tetramitiformis]|uniref:Uncharacterized protein n=1 Tax=Cymbomonas tetramitiformis TaxID=36881 RepID=A0AAE0BPJ4_9CHLO|nr:hypothetical protein CYMTET_49808 [Cymbomonas tetramitiformis]
MCFTPSSRSSADCGEELPSPQSDTLVGGHVGGLPLKGGGGEGLERVTLDVGTALPMADAHLGAVMVAPGAAASAEESKVVVEGNAWPRQLCIEEDVGNEEIVDEEVDCAWQLDRVDGEADAAALFALAWGEEEGVGVGGGGELALMDRRWEDVVDKADYAAQPEQAQYHAWVG